MEFLILLTLIGLIVLGVSIKDVLFQIGKVLIEVRDQGKEEEDG